MLSAAGGIDIESVAATTPERIHRAALDRRYGLLPHQALGLALRLYRDVGQARSAAGIMGNLYAACYAVGASLVEINPIVATPDGNILGLEAKRVMADNEIDRRPEMTAHRDDSAETPYEFTARQ